jgi:hypothetical protein
MKEKCSNHPEKKALSFCHSCGKYFCDACLVEGKEYYYCNDERCLSVKSKDEAIISKKEVVSKPSMNVATPKASRSSDELKERREWLFFAIFTYLRNEAFKKFKKEFSIDDVTFASKYDSIYSEMMIALLTSGLVNIKENLSEDDFQDIIIYYIDLVRAFGMKLKTKELMDADQIINIFTLYILVMEDYHKFMDFFVERMNKILSSDKEKIEIFTALNVIVMGLSYGRDAFHSVSIDNILKDNQQMRQHILTTLGDFGENLINILTT